MINFKDTKFTILGEEWSISIKTGTEDNLLDKISADGYTDPLVRKIVIRNDDDDDSVQTEEYLKVCTRHEVVHAFLFESGLANSTGSADKWALNEEMVDWIAIQFPKMYEVFKMLGVE